MWLRQDKDCDDFEFLSIQINDNHDAAKHRDVGNMGPSMARTVGRFDGGHLFWFPHDVGFAAPEDFPEDEAVQIDTDRFARFDGRCVHGVTPFTGERFSAIFFTPQMSSCDEALETKLMLRRWQEV